jgi:3-phosphoshikimate 1-carboxyvinyltransferase
MNDKEYTIKGEITLNGSKSISNRALIIQAISNLDFEISALSNARDTVTLERLLNQDEDIVDVGDAGTVCRFMTAYLATQPERKVLMGTKRMCERPIGVLVNALNVLGANIQYVGKEGFPPIKFNVEPGATQGGKVYISANVSSQFISALLMIAPALENGIELHLEGKIVSRPYIQMTLNLMEEFGILAVWHGNMIKVPQQTYQPSDFVVEADWSAASYYYSLAALSDSAHIQLNGLYPNSVQGDAVIVDIMKQFGVQTTFNEKGILITKETPTKLEAFVHDFTDCPDIAQTFMAVCAGLNIPAKLTGLETLAIKETDRLAAPKAELEELGCHIRTTADSFLIKKGIDKRKKKATIETYHDHRMAMSFAPLKVLIPQLKIQKPEVVQKSYPDFWKDMEQVGLVF